MLIKVQCERSETFRSGGIVGSTWQSALFPLLKMEGIIMDSCSVRYAVNVLLSWFYMVIQTTDEILRAIDKRKVADIFLSHMSKAFDNITNNEILLDK